MMRVMMVYARVCVYGVDECDSNFKLSPGYVLVFVAFFFLPQLSAFYYSSLFFYVYCG